ESRIQREEVQRFFFFQAEDGIRVFHVTGVQTCALPISPRGGSRGPPAPRGSRGSGPDGPRQHPGRSPSDLVHAAAGDAGQSRARSEERRVGRASTTPWSPLRWLATGPQP